eukprot:6467275-Amphidinium_carterae.2
MPEWLAYDGCHYRKNETTFRDLFINTPESAILNTPKSEKTCREQWHKKPMLNFEMAVQQC